MVKSIDTNAQRLKRHGRIRSKLSGTAECPRLNVFRSNKHIYAQIIDDVKGVTLAAASSMDKGFDGKSCNKDAARKVGQAIGKLAMEKKIGQVVFDRGGYLFHGRIKELADGARESGLKF